MSEGRSAIVLERAQHWIGIDLIAGAGEETAEPIAAQIVAERSHEARAGGGDVCSSGAPALKMELPTVRAASVKRILAPAGEFPLKVLFVTVVEAFPPVPTLVMPPPVAAVFPLNVLLFTVIVTVLAPEPAASTTTPTCDPETVIPLTFAAALDPAGPKFASLSTSEMPSTEFFTVPSLTVVVVGLVPTFQSAIPRSNCPPVAPTVFPLTMAVVPGRSEVT